MLPDGSEGDNTIVWKYTSDQYIIRENTANGSKTIWSLGDGVTIDPYTNLPFENDSLFDKDQVNNMCKYDGPITSTPLSFTITHSDGSALDPTVYTLN